MCVAETVMATRVELSLTNLSTTTKDFFHSSLESKMKKKKHLVTVTLCLFDPLCGDKVQSVQLPAMLAISFVKSKDKKGNNALLLHRNLIKCVFIHILGSEKDSHVLDHSHELLGLRDHLKPHVPSITSGQSKMVSSSDFNYQE